MSLIFFIFFTSLPESVVQFLGGKGDNLYYSPRHRCSIMYPGLAVSLDLVIIL
nr:MAG TPA: hypothetical protein [Caudoviricetes sp.]